jgi:hypothetical protein
MAFIEIHADLTRCAAALERIADLLDRIAPPPIEIHIPEPSTLADLHYTDADHTLPILAALNQFAQANDAVLNSPVFIQRIMEFERSVAEVYGEDAVDKLPWNADGRCFKESTQSRS